MISLTSLASAASLYRSEAVASRAATTNVASTRSAGALSSALESSRVQLSRLGQVRSATAQTEAAAQRLRDTRSTASVDGLTKAVAGFASAVNNRLAAIGNAAPSGLAKIDLTLAPTATGKTPAGAAAPSGSTASTATGASATNSQSAAANRQALAGIGITQNSDGQVAVDYQRLQTAFADNPTQVRETLTNVATSVVQQSERQLAAGSALSRAELVATNRTSELQQAQDAVQQARAVQTRQTTQRDDAQAIQSQLFAQQAFNFSGAAAYQRIFAS